MRRKDGLMREMGEKGMANRRGEKGTGRRSSGVLRRRKDTGWRVE